MQITNYTVLSGFHRPTLEEEVQKFLDSGYSLSGGVAVADVKMASGDTSLFYAQAVVIEHS